MFHFLVTNLESLDSFMHESSQYKYKSHFIAWLVSLASIKNNRVPKIEPCGTPHEIFANFETRFVTSTVKGPSNNYN